MYLYLYYLFQRAMYAHQSQMVWYRMLYVTFSRYMAINTYSPIIADLYAAETPLLEK